ncbi:hypothetical protein CEK27_003914 [Fusarium fujikuroi]|nr:hypothetical protein CEK27_003914 [Fusarium fujikuroi]QGI77146.1 hypothetical protein CEK25_003875 [Fusarium fujikuroi]
MGNISFKQLKTDTSVMATYINNILSLTDSKKSTNELHDSIENTLKLKKGGFPNHFLSITIQKTNTGISISQGAYINNILITTGLKACRPVGIPINAGLYPIAKTSSKLTNNKVYTPFTYFISKINYLSTQTQPNIAFINGL